MDRIILTSAEFNNGRLELTRDDLPVVLGRSRKCDITIDDSLLSRNHSEIRINEAGHVEVRDLESTNLTIVNDRDIDTHELQTGDVILLGETRIHVELITQQHDPNEQTTRDLTLLPGPDDETVGD